MKLKFNVYYWAYLILGVELTLLCYLFFYYFPYFTTFLCKYKGEHSYETQILDCLGYGGYNAKHHSLQCSPSIIFAIVGTLLTNSMDQLNVH